MNQEWLIKNVLKNLDSVPTLPDDDREYLSLDESQRIVDETIDYLGLHSEHADADTEYTYLCGHRKRLAHSLSLIPKARGNGESCLDIGSFGYMPHWVRTHLGYDHVEGIEWHPTNKESVIERTLITNDGSTVFSSHNFDIARGEWAIERTFDTVLFFEVLEHINTDPMGVMKRVHKHLNADGSLIMSVPNAISYKAFKEFLVGMPPWTYWFYEPDLSHEPRHCFEYTPIIFKALIKAAGLQENAFRTIFAYTEEEQEEETLQIARSLGFDNESFGETMIVNATKVSSKINLRYPDVLYSPDGYYKTVYPHLRDRLEKAVRHFHDSNTIIEPKPELAELQERTAWLEQQKLEQETQINELLYTCDRYIQRECELESSQALINAELVTSSTDAQKSRDIALEETRNTSTRALDLERVSNEQQEKINELLFTIDCYMRKEGDREQQLIEAQSETDTMNSALLAAEQRATVADSRVLDLEAVTGEQRIKISELLFAIDCYMRKEDESKQLLADAQSATDRINTTRLAAEQHAAEADINVQVHEVTIQEQQTKINELLFTVDCYMRKEGELESAHKEALAEQNATVESAQSERDAAITTSQDSRQWAENLANENVDLRGQVNELLFACDCYLQQINDPARCAQIIRERRFRSVLRTSKSVVRKTPILRTALRPVYRSTKKFIKRRL
jgi:SAM-dependent methyltransferase